MSIDPTDELNPDEAMVTLYQSCSTSTHILSPTDFSKLSSPGEYNQPASLPEKHVQLDREKSPLLQRQHSVDDTTGWTFRLLSLILLVNMGGVLIGFNNSILNPIMHDIWVDAHFDTPATRGFLVSSSALGGFGGAIIGAKSMQSLGRKKSVIIADIFITLGALLVLLMPNYVITLDLSRIISGAGVGLAGVSIPVYLSEISPPKIRGGAVALCAVAQNIGIILAIGTSVFLWNSKGNLRVRPHFYWKWIMSFECLPALLHMTVMLWFPQSPRWLVQHNQWDEARRVLRLMLDIDDVTARQKIRDMARTYAQISHPKLNLWTNLRSRGFKKAVVLGCTLAIVQQVSGINTLMNYSSTIFVQVGLAANTQSAVNWTLLVVGLQLVFAVVSIGIIDKYGRKPLLVYSLYGVTVSLAALASSAFLSTRFPNAEWPRWMTFGAMLMYIATYGFGLGPVPDTINSEIFPTHLRGAGSSIYVCVTWLASAVVTLLFPLITEFLGMGVAFSVSVVGTLFGIFFARTCVFETKGQSLESILKNFSRQVSEMDINQLINV